jgi:hypothetical protein
VLQPFAPSIPGGVPRPAGGRATLARMRPASPLCAQLGLGLALTAGLHAADDASTCFDFSQTVVTPLRPPIPLLDGRDNSAYGTYPSGVDWAAGRAVVRMPIGDVYDRLLDHRNVKDMRKTTLVTRVLDRPGYLQFHHLDVQVRLRALFVRLKVAWTEAWAYCLAEGTPTDPREIVVSYQKIGGTRHIRHECGSYVLRARDDGSTDLSLYEEIQASRRSAEDTRDMHAGILENIRGSAQ